MLGRTSLALALCCMVLRAGPALPQSAVHPAPTPLPAPHNGEFQKRFRDADRLLRSLPLARSYLYERLHAESAASAERLDPHAYRDRLGEILRGRAGAPADAAAEAWATRRARAIFAAADALRRQIYDVYADDRVLEKEGAVERLVDHYLAQPGLALPAVPKSIEIMESPDHSMHGDHRMPSFRDREPGLSGLLWAQKWVELAVADPLMRLPTEAERRVAVAAVVERFEEMVRDSSARRPTAVPTTPAIAPDLSRRHPRAAAILDNVNMMHSVIADLLVNEHLHDTRAAVDEVVRRFTDPTHLAVSEYDWMLMALRQGIYDQGGPAIGRLERSERNGSSHFDRHGNPVLPGMHHVPPDAKAGAARKHH